MEEIFIRLGRGDPMLLTGTRMSFITSILMELFTCKLHVSLSSYSQPSGGAFCAADRTHRWPPFKGRLPFFRNFSMNWYSTADILVRLERGDPMLLTETRMSFIWWILMELLTCKLHVSLPSYSPHRGCALCAADRMHLRPPSWR